MPLAARAASASAVRALAVIATIAVLGCSTKPADPTRAAATLAEGLSAAVAVTLADSRPPLCAVWPGRAATTIEETITLAAGVQVHRLDHRLSFIGGSSLSVVADARQPSAQIAATAAALRDQWEQAGVVLVVALGGMGQSADDLRPVLAALASRAWVLLVNAGDRESVAALELVVAELRSRGLPAFATTEVREVEVAGARLAVLPGVAHESGLVAGGDGCLHREEDAAAMAAQLATHPGARMWMSYAAPRQRDRGERATDLSSGVHSGEPELSAAVVASGAQLLVHAQIAPSLDALESGSVAASSDGQATTYSPLAVGPLEDLPLALGNAAASLKGKSEHAGVIVTIARQRMTWQRTRRVGPVRR